MSANIEERTNKCTLWGALKKEVFPSRMTSVYTWEEAVCCKSSGHLLHGRAITAA